MRTRGDIKERFTPMLFAVNTSSYFTPTRIENAISDAHLIVADEKPWPDIKKGFLFDTSGDEYYDYPENCQSGSVFKISINGVSDYKKIDFEDFLAFKENNPDSLDRYFAEYGRQFFVTPIPDSVAEGTKNGVIWGVIQASELVSDDSITIFSDWADSVNEAIMLWAYHNMILNIDADRANDALSKAKLIINNAYDKLAKRNQRKQRVDKPMFDVPDFFGGGVSSSKNFQVNE